jgi:hypothetical protein
MDIGFDTITAIAVKSHAFWDITLGKSAESRPTFRRSTSPPSSRSNNKTSKKSAGWTGKARKNSNISVTCKLCKVPIMKAEYCHSALAARQRLKLFSLDSHIVENVIPLLKRDMQLISQSSEI